MTEETKDTTESTETAKQPQLDKATVDELIKTNLKEAIAGLQQQQQATQQVNAQPVQQKEPDFWADILDPHIKAGTAQADLNSAIAMDKVDFYSSDEWLTEVDEYLTEDDPTKRKTEKANLRKEVERVFDTNVKQNRGLPRSDVLKGVLGHMLIKDPEKFKASASKKATAEKESELDKAKKAVSIGAGNITNFSAADINSMTLEKVQEQFGSMEF